MECVWARQDETQTDLLPAQLLLGKPPPVVPCMCAPPCVQEVLGVARRRGWRLNLRWLGELQTLAWLVGLVLLGRWLAALITSEGGLFGLDEQYYAEQQQWKQQQAQAARQAAAAAAAPQQHQYHWEDHL